MSRNRFTNPATGVHYDWTVNHTEEDETGKTRNITRSAPTGGVGLVRQQGDDGPYLLRYTGTILHRAQWQAMWAWFALCRTQTIYFADYDGQQYEVQITSFTGKRVRKLANTGKDPSIPHHNYTYTIEMEVYRFMAGDLAGSGVTP